MSEWQPARLIPAHEEIKKDMPRHIFSDSPKIRDTRGIVLIREIPRNNIMIVVCDAEKFYEVKEESGGASAVCEHEILTD
jgi:hypothetical protein